jgi:uncharacterized protein YndB with AHSA1/START domain
VQAKVTREFACPAERVYQAWLEPKSIGTWMFGPAVREEEVVALLTEAKVGGEFSFIVRRRGAKISHVGRYLEMEKPHRLVFTWGVKEHAGDNSRVAVVIEETAEGCVLTLTHEMPSQWADYVAKVEASWELMLAALDKSLQ